MANYEHPEEIILEIHVAMDEVDKKLGMKKRMSCVTIGEVEHWFWEDKKGRNVVRLLEEASKADTNGSSAHVLLELS